MNPDNPELDPGFMTKYLKMLQLDKKPVLRIRIWDLVFFYPWIRTWDS
jgi:hypothetical protein